VSCKSLQLHSNYKQFSFIVPVSKTFSYSPRTPYINIVFLLNFLTNALACQEYSPIFAPVSAVLEVFEMKPRTLVKQLSTRLPFIHIFCLVFITSLDFAYLLYVTIFVCCP
jgi:hypothetical protein